MRAPKQASVPPGIFGLVFLMFFVTGLFFAYFGFVGLVRANASKQWPTVEGRVLASSVERKVDRDSDGNRTTTYHTDILYEYSADDMMLNGSRVSYGDMGTGSPGPAQAIVRRYPKGAKVTVYYMPGKPEECLLEPGLSAGAFAMPFMGLLSMGIGVGSGVAWIRGVRKRRETAAAAG